MNHDQGIFCLSVDCRDADRLAIDCVHRQRQLLEIVQRYEIPANWTIDETLPAEAPQNAEVTVEVPKGQTRRELIQHLRQMSASLLKNNAMLRSVVLDPHEAREHWDVLLRQGCTVARPRTAGVTRDITPRIVRGGLWVVPLTCQFVGGSRRSVRSLFSHCQRHLVEAARAGKLFHLNVDLGKRRESWPEELDAIRALLETATAQRAKDQLRFATLSSLPAILTGKPPQPMLSILKRSA